MASVTLSLSKEFKAELQRRPWINWSSIAREELMKKKIFEEYLKKREISDEEWTFCESIDWHPVDELPLKKEYKAKIMKRAKGPFIKLKSVSDIFRE
jgi:hypothetical protein